MPKISEYEAPVQVRMDEGAYDAVPLKIDGPIETEYNGVKREKLVLTYEVADVELQCWMTNTITKGEGNYSNSALYDWLVKMGKYKEFIKKQDQLRDDSAFIAWANAWLSAEKPKVQVVVKNSNKDKENEYSTVREVLKVL